MLQNEFESTRQQSTFNVYQNVPSSNASKCNIYIYIYIESIAVYQKQ